MPAHAPSNSGPAFPKSLCEPGHWQFLGHAHGEKGGSPAIRRPAPLLLTPLAESVGRGFCSLRTGATAGLGVELELASFGIDILNMAAVDLAPADGQLNGDGVGTSSGGTHDLRGRCEASARCPGAGNGTLGVHAKMSKALTRGTTARLQAEARVGTHSRSGAEA